MLNARFSLWAQRLQMLKVHPLGTFPHLQMVLRLGDVPLWGILLSSGAAAEAGVSLDSEETVEVGDHAFREKAKGATFFEATEGETVRPMLDVAWAPMLGAFSVLFEEFNEGKHLFCKPFLPSSPNEISSSFTYIIDAALAEGGKCSTLM